MTLSNHQTIELEVVKATSITQFNQGGKRRLYMHYYLKMPDGNKHKWQLYFIDQQTNLQLIIKQEKVGKKCIMWMLPCT